MVYISRNPSEHVSIDALSLLYDLITIAIEHIIATIVSKSNNAQR